QALSLVASEAVSAAAVLPGITPVSRPLNIQPFRVQRVPIGRQQVECVRGAHENILRPLETRIGDVEGMDLDRRRDRYRSGMPVMDERADVILPFLKHPAHTLCDFTC